MGSLSSGRIAGARSPLSGPSVRSFTGSNANTSTTARTQEISLNKQQRWQQRQLQAGLCYTCGKPNEDPKFAACEACRMKRREK